MTSSQDPNVDPSTVRGRKVSPEEVAYRDGYVQGRTNEGQIRRAAAAQAREDAARIRAADDGAANGLLAGLLIAIIALCIGGGAYYLFRGTEPAVDPNAETPVDRETTVIERTIDRTREVVQPPAVDPPDVNLPDVEVNVPENNAPAGEAPAPVENQPVETAPPTTETQAPAPAETAQ